MARCPARWRGGPLAWDRIQMWSLPGFEDWPTVPRLRKLSMSSTHARLAGLVLRLRQLSPEVGVLQGLGKCNGLGSRELPCRPRMAVRYRKGNWPRVGPELRRGVWFEICRNSRVWVGRSGLPAWVSQSSTCLRASLRAARHLGASLPVNSHRVLGGRPWAQ